MIFLLSVTDLSRPSVKGAADDRMRQPHIRPSWILVEPAATRLPIAVVTVASVVVSGVSAVLLHMKFGPPGMPPTVIPPGSDRCTCRSSASTLVSAMPLPVPPQAALPLWQVQLADVTILCVPDWLLPLVLMAVPPLVEEIVNVVELGTVFT